MKSLHRFSKRLVDGVWMLTIKIKYPKLVVLAVAAVLAFLLFRSPGMQSFFHSLGEFGYLSAFFGGMLFAFGFGAPFGVAILLTIADDISILPAAVLGGLGALVTDYLLFKFIRVTFDEEIKRIRSSRLYYQIQNRIFGRLPPRMSYYFVASLAGLFIASPLPDEFGVAILASVATIRERTFAVISLSLNTLGILGTLGLGLLA
jgi:uncharacterized membrane protein